MTQRRLRVLLSAYACEPGRGSEPGVGWNLALALAKSHDVWVLTRENNRTAIEDALPAGVPENLKFVHFDLPTWARWWKRGGRGVQLYYYLWQLAAVPIARQLHRNVNFDLAHHVTFAKYWAPAAVAFIGIPFVWGPVGGGESVPRALLKGMSLQGKLYEWMRSVARHFGELDPLVRAVARRAAFALATTQETANRLRIVGARSVVVVPAVAVSCRELDHQSLSTGPSNRGPAQFVAVGRLLGWKGYHLLLRAFAQVHNKTTRLRIVGAGPELERLRSEAGRLGISDRVHFVGSLSRDAVLKEIADSDALIHPSLHDSGGMVLLEAMASAKPVICLDLGGPAEIVPAEAGIRVPAQDLGECTRGLASAMDLLASNVTLRNEMGLRGREVLRSRFTWEGRAILMGSVYAQVLEHVCDMEG